MPLAGTETSDDGVMSIGVVDTISCPLRGRKPFDHY